MNIEEFVTNIAEQYVETDPAVFTPQTEYKELEEWSSLITLSIIAMVDAEYDVALKGEDFDNTKTIEDLFNLVNSKK